ncbi:transporter [Halobaculum sp. D14]|uniref:transporter n=1 Tax=unclassified Halobaculum TaxID=2640896 RepID=UPI003EBC2F3B
MSQTASRSPTDDVPFGVGAVAGVAAYALGYLVTYLWQSGAVREQLNAFNFLAELLGGDPIPVWKGVGWYFYNAHFVDVLVPGLGGARTANFIASADGGNIALLYAVPPVLLLLAGAAAGALSDADVPSDGAVAGLSVVPAYFVFAAAGTFLFAYGVGDAGSVHPDYVTGVLLAGVVYPAVFGGVGGAAASLFE